MGNDVPPTVEEWRRAEKTFPCLLMRLRSTPDFAEASVIRRFGAADLLFQKEAATDISVYMHSDERNALSATAELSRSIGQDGSAIAWVRPELIPRHPVHAVVSEYSRRIATHFFHEETAAEHYKDNRNQALRGHHLHFERDAPETGR